MAMSSSDCISLSLLVASLTWSQVTDHRSQIAETRALQRTMPSRSARPGLRPLALLNGGVRGYRNGCRVRNGS